MTEGHTASFSNRLAHTCGHGHPTPSNKLLLKLSLSDPVFNAPTAAFAGTLVWFKAAFFLHMILSLFYS